jgi:hypothetical protein
MTTFQQRLPNDFDSLVRRIEALERELQETRAARRLEAATIGRGGITIKGGAIILEDNQGREIGRMGIREDLLPQPDGQRQPGFILRRNDGSVAFTLDDPNPNAGGYRQLIKMQDSHGTIIFEEDAVTGWGLAAPTWSVPLFPFDQDYMTKWPATTTTSDWVLFNAAVPIYNPRLFVSVMATLTSGISGEMWVTVNGQTLGTSKTVASGSMAQLEWEMNLNDISGMGSGAIVSLQIHARAGTAANPGRLVATPIWCYTDGAPGNWGM